MSRYFLELSYKGTPFHGWQVQPNALTVQELLNKALSAVFRENIDTIGSGRTDTGVHALQQFAHFDIDKNFDVGKTLNSINALLPYDISVNKLHRVEDTAHARFDAISRTYHYFMHFEKNPFHYQRSWKVKNDFDLDLMNQGAKLIMTYNDFSCFCKSNDNAKTHNCTITEAFWTRKEDQVLFIISANRFLRNMVRAIVGTLLQLGRGKIDLDDLESILKNKNRSKAGESVPAEGLYLADVKYPYINNKQQKIKH